MLTEKSRRRLEKFGWSSDRNINIKPYKKVLEEEGYQVHESVVKCLQSYGGMKIWVNDRKDADDIQIDPIVATETIYAERVTEEYNLEAGKNLCVIGLYHRGHMVVMMDDEGAVYGGYDEHFSHLGNSLEAFLNKICK